MCVLIALDKEVFVELVAAYSLRRRLLLMSAPEVISAKQRLEFQDLIHVCVHNGEINATNVTTRLLKAACMCCFGICVRSKPKGRGFSFSFQFAQFDLIASK